MSGRSADRPVYVAISTRLPTTRDARPISRSDAAALMANASECFSNAENRASGCLSAKVSA